VFGIVGSAYMDALDMFPAAGIRFIPVAHEQGAAHMTDGYARTSGRHGVCITDARPRRLPGDGTAADLLEDHEVPGSREQPEAHGRDRGTLHFHPAVDLAEATISAVQRRIRSRVLRLAVRHGALTPDVAADLARWGHGGGFSLHDSAGTGPTSPSAIA
jgi:hypothetical protein